MKPRVRWLAIVLTAATLVPTVGVFPARGSLTDPVPSRERAPWPAGTPWPGFRPAPPAEGSFVPLAGEADPGRWPGWVFGERAAYGTEARLPQTGSPQEATVPSGETPPSGTGSFLDRETCSFRENWKRALSAARRGDAEAVLSLLRDAQPGTAAGRWRARRLAFAAAVAAEDRAAADSLFYRISWSDGGRTGTRLAAWRALERGEGDRAVRLLEVLPDPSPGERAALALARWMTEPQVADTTLEREPVPTATEAPLALAVLRLARARNAVLRGDTASAGRWLREAEAVTKPEPWMDLERRLVSLLAGPDATAPETASLRKAEEAFLAGRDEEARARLDAWLAAWPESRLRGEAYRLRGELQLAAGSLDEADADLRIASRRGSGETAERARLARAFVLARRGRASDARSLFTEVFDGDLGARAEPELLFDRVRLARLGADSVALRATLLRLEEGYPDGPWPGRARADTAAARWGRPWRAVSSEPAEGTVTVPLPPGEAPWGSLLWGEGVLAQTAADLAKGPSPMETAGAPATGGTVPSPPPAEPRTTGARGRAASRGFVALAGGAPVEMRGEGGIGGRWNALRYRLAATGRAGGERNELPEFRRGGWEAGLGTDRGRWRVDGTAAGDIRRDGNASAVGLLDHPVEAWWRGGRVDVAVGESPANRLTAFGAWTKGEVDAGATGVWSLDEVWFGLEADLRVGTARWRATTQVARRNHRCPAFLSSFRRWYRDLRILRLWGSNGVLGLRGSLYDRRGLLMPVARWEKTVGRAWTVWGASEPELVPPSFRKRFVADGDWNVPDFTLPAERRLLDLRGGVRWRDDRGGRFALSAATFRIEHLHGWRRDGGLWKETGVEDAVGREVTAEAQIRSGKLRTAVRVRRQRVTADGRRVAFVPRWTGSLELEYGFRGWRWGVRAYGVEGRRADDGTPYGSFLRWDLETAYRWRGGNLPLGARWVELTVQVENLTDVADRRWPGVPGTGTGVYAGVRTGYGDD